MRRPSQAVFYGLFEVGGGKLEDSTEESGTTIPIQRAEEIRRELLCPYGMEGNGARCLRAVFGGVL